MSNLSISKPPFNKIWHAFFYPSESNSELTKLYSTYTIVPLQLHYCKDNGQLFLATIVCELRHYHAEATLRKKNNPHQKSSNVPFTYFPEKGEKGWGHQRQKNE